MKKAIIIVVSVAGFLFTALVVARLTKAIVTYYIPTESSMPTLTPGTVVVASVLIKPQHDKFIVYNNDKSIQIHRCIGMENDIIQIKGGDVYRNGKKLNEPYTWNEYLIPNSQLAHIKEYIKKIGNPTTALTDSTTLITLSEVELEKYHFKLNRYTFPANESYPLYKDFQKAHYSVDNLGPIKVPAKSYFIMGDNRHNSLDSRYLGFISEDEIVAGLIGY